MCLMGKIMDMVLFIQQFFDWRALVDIFLIAAGLFFLYRTLQRLGTWGIAAGILVAMLGYMLASLLDLRGIEWVFGNLSQVAVLALIIIFQPELRKIFERASSVRRTKKLAPGHELVGILVSALWNLADKRQGALVVIPGNEPIQEWLTGGLKLDAAPSIPLIMSLFDPNSPGHDGAVIISKGKLANFGVRLPASQSMRLSEEFGTRHHAAMGLSERSDALVLVVSEERGKISIFKHGKMHAISDRKGLTTSINEHWQNLSSYALNLPRDETRWQRFAQMAASLALAVFFWSTLIIAQGEMIERVFTVPVEFTASPQHLALVGKKELNVRLHISGPKSNLALINPLEMGVKIDLSKAVPGNQTFVITADNMRLPREIKLLDVIPSSIQLTLAEIVEREVAIKPQLLGKLPGNQSIQSIRMIPATIRVFSPASDKKNSITAVMTTPVYLDSIYGNTTVFCKIIAPPSLQPVEKRWPDVEIVITVGNE